MGTTGYCMGGPLVMRTAAANPERVGAAATFHGGGLVTDKPDSPHLLIPKMKAQFLIAIAANDDAKHPDVKDMLKEAFAQASLPAEIEVYRGAKHGWCPPDSHVYDGRRRRRRGAGCSRSSASARLIARDRRGDARQMALVAARLAEAIEVK